MSTSSGGGWRRTLWEVLILALLAAAGWLAWNWQTARHQEAQVEAEESLQAEFLAKRQALEERLSTALGEEAEAVARTFAAAIVPEVTTQNWGAVDRAAVELLFLPKLAFVHLLDPDGKVLVSSDRKLLATGYAGEAGSWALTAAETVRRSEPDGLVEVASPIEVDGEVAAVLWLGYQPAEADSAD
ncbi:MAG: hypothetical protein AAGC60_15000 [Acidobacteriota bacterium]